MLPNILTALVAALLAPTPLLWAHGPGQTAVTVLAAACAAVCSVASFANPAYRTGVAAAGALLVLSAFALSDEVATMAVQLTAGYLFLGAGMAPQIKRVAAADTGRTTTYEERRAA